MAHEIENINGKDCMAYTGETPWHGLGTKVDHLMTAEEAIKAAGLDWTVSMKPVYLANGVQVPRYQAIVRDTDAQVYAVVGANYVPVQNRDAFKFFDDVVGTGEAYYETAGSLRGGSRVWMLANLKGSISVKGEEVKRYLTLTNSHDGYLALQMFWTPVRVVCMNTLNMALSGAGARFYARHTASAGKKINEAKEILGLANKFYADWQAKANAMAMKQLPPARMPLLLAAAFQTSGSVEAKLYPPVVRQMDRVKELVEVGRGMDNPAIKGTVWQAYNAVAEFADYDKTYRDETPSGKLYGAWFGGGAELKERAWDWCLREVANKN